MDINGVIRVNMTGAEIEEALMKARDLPTNAQLTTILNEMQADIDERLGRIEEKTYNEMVAIRDASDLVPGQLYRITDYVTTTMVEHTRSKKHPFDVVVLAVSANKLSEEALAMQHDSEDYFDDDINKWQLRYSLDNIKHSSVLGHVFTSDNYRFQYFGQQTGVDGKTYSLYTCDDYPTVIVVTDGVPTVGNYFAEVDISKFPQIVISNPRAGIIDWVSVGGTGTITYLRDERGNEACFDFYNIEFKRWKVDSTYVLPDIQSKYVGVLGNLPADCGLSIPDNSDFQWFSLFKGSEFSARTHDVVTRLTVESNVIMGTSHDSTLFGEFENCTFECLENVSITGSKSRVITGLTISDTVWDNSCRDCCINGLISYSHIQGNIGRTIIGEGYNRILMKNLYLYGEIIKCRIGTIAYCTFKVRMLNCVLGYCYDTSFHGTLLTDAEIKGVNGGIEVRGVDINVNKESASGTLWLPSYVNVAWDSQGEMKTWNPADLVQ